MLYDQSQAVLGISTHLINPPLLFQIVEQYESFGIDALVSNYGGMMSLWAGASLLTVVQFFVYLFYALACVLIAIKDKLIALANREIRVAPEQEGQKNGSAKILKNERISVIDLVRSKPPRSSRLASSSDA